MHKKDYILIAKTLNKCQPDKTDSCWALWAHISISFAEALASNYPQFDKDLFNGVCKEPKS